MGFRRTPSPPFLNCSKFNNVSKTLKTHKSTSKGAKLGNDSVDLLSESIQQSLFEGVELHGHASLVACGGRSPLSLYEKLSHADIDWGRVSIYLGDDRIVSSGHSDSNENIIRETLLINNASSAKFHSLLHPQISLASIKLPFDVVLLGLGNDGHFASLFPDLLNHSSAFDVNATPDFVVSDRPLGSPSHRRISMNLAMLLNTRKCFLLVTDEDKRKIRDKSYTDKKLPLHFLLSQKKTKVLFSDY